MEAFVHVIVSIVSLAVSAMQLLMLARAIFSWLPTSDDSPLQRFLFCATEPVILPIRNVMEKISFFSSLPIDLSFLVAYMLLTLISYLLPAVKF